MTMTNDANFMSGAVLGLSRSESLVFSVHWLELSIWPLEDQLEENLTKIMYAVNSCLFGRDQVAPASLWERFDWGGNFFAKHASTALGIKLFWDNCSDKETLHLQIRGRALDELFFCQLQALVRYLDENVARYLKCSRIDVAWDHCPFTVEQVRAASAKKANLRTKAKIGRYLESKTGFG